jgi:hypothetical protein
MAKKPPYEARGPTDSLLVRLIGIRLAQEFSVLVMMIICEVSNLCGKRVRDLTPILYAVWDLPRKYLLPDEPLGSFRPAVSINHDCQTVRDSLIIRVYCLAVLDPDQYFKGRWVTVFKAQWSQNPDVYPHFSVSFSISLRLWNALSNLERFARWDP